MKRTKAVAKKTKAVATTAKEGLKRLGGHVSSTLEDLNLPGKSKVVLALVIREAVAGAVEGAIRSQRQ